MIQCNWLPICARARHMAWEPQAGAAAGAHVAVAALSLSARSAAAFQKRGGHQEKPTKWRGRRSRKRRWRGRSDSTK